MVIETDTGNIVYTVTRPQNSGSSLESVDMYDLVKEALRRSAYHMVSLLVKRAAQRHGISLARRLPAMVIQYSQSIATNTETVWSRFLMIARAHESARGLPDYKIAEGFADAVCAIVFIGAPSYLWSDHH